MIKTDICKVAKAEIGVKESPLGSNNVKYNTWFYGRYVAGSGYSWCAVFVSWCANKAGISTNIIPKTASVSNLLSFFQNKNRYKKKGTYTPKPGDIMIQKSNGASHTGIVIRSTATTFTTIEGNTSNMVAERNYSLWDSKLSGFGIPAYATNGKNSGGGVIDGDETENQTTEATINNFDETVSEVQEKEKKEITSTVIKSISGSTGSIRQFVDVDNPNAPSIELYIRDNVSEQIYKPIVKDGITWETERQGAPGKLTFTVIKDPNISFNEGSSVIFKVNKKNIFYGYVFEKARDKEHHIQVTAYDQLRYLKNKHTYMYTNKGTNDLIQMIAADFRLRVGNLEDTKFKIPYKIEDNLSLLDMIQNSIDDTVLNTNNLYILYDDFGYLTLKNAANMKINDIVINNLSAQNFDYKTTINNNTYNKIQLYYDNEETGQREFYITQDGENISRWGILQLTEKLNNGEAPASKGKAMLSLYNSVARGLTVNDAFGDLRVRAGVSVITQLNLGDLITNNYMMVEKATHNFESNLHTMTLSLIKGSFS